MTKKDYELIAAAIKIESDNFKDDIKSFEVVYFTARGIASALRVDNPRFDSARFMKACGV